MAVTNTARLVIAGVGIVVVIVVALIFMNRGNKETTIYLENDGQRCKVKNKEASVTIKKDKQMTWIIDDEECDFKDEVVWVGNFRLNESGSPDDCAEATAGGSAWPFQEDETDPSNRKSQGKKIKLHTKKDEELPGDSLPYYYDVCTGEQGDKKSDPMLVIEK
jgi:hypothetical protein